jgi:hypothetical protein
LDIFQTQKDSEGLTRQLDGLFEGSWDPILDKNGAASGRGDAKDQYPGPEVCWNYNAEQTPFGLLSMTEDEKEVREHVQMREANTLLTGLNSSSPPPSILQ